MAEALEVTPAELDAFADRLGEVESYLHLDEKRTRVTELEAKSVAPGFWDDADAARATMEEIARAKEDIAAVDACKIEHDLSVESFEAIRNHIDRSTAN